LSASQQDDAPAARRRDADRTRSDILDVATREFADRGYEGARVDEIAVRTRTSKRMIYYYFGGKEQLYVAVLQRAYSVVRAVERNADIAHLDPVTALRTLAELTFDHHQSHPDFIRLVSIENISRAEHMSKIGDLERLGQPAMGVIGRILEQGRAQGIFRRPVDAVDVHMIISAICFFSVSNRYTFAAIFGRDLAAPASRNRYRGMVGDIVVDYVTAADGEDTAPPFAELAP
jgi:AcrR family transcriptional regulator